MPRFVPDAAEQARLPVAILGGFLGSGKTTLLNALLRHPAMADTAVAINEFGEVPIDQHLVEADSGAGPDRTVTMANGCLCCDMSGDLEGAVMRIFSRREAGLPRFARLLVEPSGLADPAPIAQALLRNPILSRVLRLDAILVTADAVLGRGQLARHPEARAQAVLADRLLLTKTDLADPAEEEALRDALASLNPLAPLTRTRRGEAEPAELFPARFLGIPGAPPPVAEWLAALPASAPAHHHHAHSEGIASLSLVSDDPPPWEAFEAWFRRVRIEGGERLLRAKGLIGVPGREGPVVVEAGQPVPPPPVALPSWPAEDRRSRLVLITDRIPHAPLRAGWDALFQPG